MLQVKGVTKSFGIERVLDDVSFAIHSSECVALIGPNGCGKSTLFRIIAGAEQPDRGSIVLAPRSRLGWLPQAMQFEPDRTVADYSPLRLTVN